MVWSDAAAVTYFVVMNDSSAAESMADLVQSMEGAERVATMVGQLC